PFAVPELEKRLHATNSVIRRRAAGALAYIGPAAEPAIPSLLALLGDTEPWVRAYAADGLGRFGESAQAAVPDLLAIANDRDPKVSNSVRRALKQIDPSTLNTRSQ